MEKKESKKKFLLILVIFFTVVIFFIWLWLFRWQFNSINDNSSKKEDLLNEPEIKSSLEQLKSQFSDFTGSIKELLNQKKSTSTPVLTNEQIKTIKEKVQEELNSNINNNPINDN